MRMGVNLVNPTKTMVYFIFYFIFCLFILAFFILNTGIFFPCFFDAGTFFYQNNSLTLSYLVDIFSIYFLFY